MLAGRHLEYFHDSPQHIEKGLQEREFYLLAKNFNQWTQQYQFEQFDENLYPLPLLDREAVRGELRRMYRYRTQRHPRDL